MVPEPVSDLAPRPAAARVHLIFRHLAARFCAGLQILAHWSLRIWSAHLGRSGRSRPEWALAWLVRLFSLIVSSRRQCRRYYSRLRSGSKESRSPVPVSDAWATTASGRSNRTYL